MKPEAPAFPAPPEYRGWWALVMALTTSPPSARVHARVAEVCGSPLSVVLPAILAPVPELAADGLMPPTLAWLRRYPFHPSPARREELVRGAEDPDWRRQAGARVRVLSEHASRGADIGGPGEDEAVLAFAGHLLRQLEILVAVDAAERDPASVHAGLDGADRLAVRDLLLGVEGARRTFDGYIRAWGRLANDPRAETGDAEWRDGLGVRDRCEQAVQACSPRGGAHLRAVLSPLDQAFFDGTETSHYPVGIGRTWRPCGWWWSRMPRDDDGTFRATAQIEWPRTP